MAYKSRIDLTKYATLLSVCPTINLIFSVSRAGNTLETKFEPCALKLAHALVWLHLIYSRLGN